MNTTYVTRLGVIVCVRCALRLHQQVRDFIVATLLHIHLFDLISSGVETSGAADAYFTRVVLRSKVSVNLITSICNVRSLAHEIRMSDVHFSAWQPRSSNCINCQLRHSILIKYDLFIMNLSLQAADFSFTFPSLLLELFDIVFVLCTFQVE